MILDFHFLISYNDEGGKGVILSVSPNFFFGRKKILNFKKKMGSGANFTPFTPDLPL
jgi:hypothetical protein